MTVTVSPMAKVLRDRTGDNRGGAGQRRICTPGRRRRRREDRGDAAGWRTDGVADGMAGDDCAMQCYSFQTFCFSLDALCTMHICIMLSHARACPCRRMKRVAQYRQACPPVQE